jgi:hypothetical protein
MMALADDIRENYPQYAWAINHPELGPLLRQAVNPSQPFSATRFRAKLMATHWWRSRQASHREWDIKAHTDPGQAERERRNYRVDLSQLTQKLGLKLDQKQIRWFTELALQRGLSPDSPEMMATFANLFGKGNLRGPAGQFHAAKQQVLNMARNEYFVPVTDRDQHNLGTRMVIGTLTEEAVREEMSRRAASRYRHLAKDLSSGKTMRELFDGHIATIAEELELDPDKVDLMSPQWSKVLDTFDPTNKQHRAATLSEVMTMARRDGRFWNTSNGKAMASSLSTKLLETFGKR